MLPIDILKAQALGILPGHLQGTMPQAGLKGKRAHAIPQGMYRVGMPQLMRVDLYPYPLAQAFKGKLNSIGFQQLTLSVHP